MSPKIDGPTYAVSDGAHNGNPDFFFLPPLFSNPNTNPNFNANAFNPNLKPAVEICELGAPAIDGSRDCIAGPALKRFDPSVVTMSVSDQSYMVNWHTDESNLNVSKYYRIRVLIGTALLGFADVDPVSSGSQLKNVQTNQYIALLDGRTLPIKFRIENGALCAVAGSPCAGKTINLTQGGEVELLGGGEDFKFDVPAGNSATFGSQVVTNVTFNLEVCNGINVDLPKVGSCLRVSTYFDATGSGELTFTKSLLLSMCVLNGDIHTPDETRQEDLITLHQQDGPVIRALPHAVPNCSTIGASSWNRIKNLAARWLMPARAEAAIRSSMLHLGGGGSTGVLGATCTPTGSAVVPGVFMTTSCPPSSPIRGSAPRPSPMATFTPPHTVSDFQFALPAKMDYINRDGETGFAPDSARYAIVGSQLPTGVRVTDWDGNPVQGAHVAFVDVVFEGTPDTLATATSDANGIAQFTWSIGQGGAVQATGRGIAATNNYPNAPVKPFMPDISDVTPEQPVALGTGKVLFEAFGVPADQQNLLDGTLAGQGIGRFNDTDGSPDPTGTSFDFQDAQSFTPGVSGLLSQIRVPLINNAGATDGVTMQIVAVVDGTPDETHSLGEVTIPASAISTNFGSVTNPATWAVFDLSGLGINVVQGQALAFILRTVSPKAYLFNPELDNGYPNGSGFRRNRALGTAWTAFADFGFQTFVTPN